MDKKYKKIIGIIIFALLSLSLIINLYLFLEYKNYRYHAEKKQSSIDELFKQYLEEVDIVSLVQNGSEQEYYKNIYYLDFASELVYKSSYAGYAKEIIAGIDNDIERSSLTFSMALLGVVRELKGYSQGYGEPDLGKLEKIQEQINGILENLDDEEVCTSYIKELDALVD